MKNSNVDAEVDKLFKKTKGNVSAADLNNLRRKYTDVELADKVQASFVEKHRKITKKAKKFAQLIRERYSNEQYPFHLLLNKALKYKSKLGLSDAEFAEFQRIYEQELVGIKSQDAYVPATYMQKVLGGLTADGSSSGFNVNDNDYRHLQEILKLASSSRPLHAQVVLQSLQYEDMSVEAVQGGRYMPEHGHRLGQHVHPVVVALFLPKIDLVEQHFLHANLANLVKTRYNNEKIQTLPDYELFYNLITDPNDIVCSNRSPVMDLLNRCNLQNQLWNSVLNLRAGQHYNNSLTEFVSAIDLCKQNKNDNPDLIYGRHDGTVLKRLISAFSFRPTVVASLPHYQQFNTNPYSMNIKPTVTSVPMINLKLPLIMDDDTPVMLRDAKDASQLFVNHNGQLEYRNTSLIYSRGVLMFYVDRRANLVKLNEYQPFSLNKLPTPIAGFERVNNRKVEYDLAFRIRDDKYELRSVVCAKVNEKLGSGNVVIGSMALVRSHETGQALCYDAYEAANPARKNQAFATCTPEQFKEMAETTGTVFIYQLTEDNTKGEIVH